MGIRTSRNRCILFIVMVILVSALVVPTGCKTAEFELSSLEITPSDIATGGTATISVNVTNVGTAEGTYTLTLSLDGVAVETKDVNVQGMSTRQITFTVVRETVGEYTVEIGNLSGTLYVIEPVILEFREYREVANEGNDEIGIWVPATGIINGEERVLNSSYFEDNTYVTTSQIGQIILYFHLNEEGAILLEQITSRLYVLDYPFNRLAIFKGSGEDAEPLVGEDGQPLAPAVVDVIIDKGIISGLSIEDANNLSRQLNVALLLHNQ